MKVKYKKGLKYSDEVEVGDQFKVGGLLCEVMKIDNVFHHTPDAFLRFELKVIGATPKTSRIVVFFPHMIPVNTRK